MTFQCLYRFADLFLECTSLKIVTCLKKSQDSDEIEICTYVSRRKKVNLTTEEYLSYNFVEI